MTGGRREARSAQSRTDRRACRQQPRRAAVGARRPGASHTRLSLGPVRALVYLDVVQSLLGVAVNPDSENCAVVAHAWRTDAAGDDVDEFVGAKPLEVESLSRAAQPCLACSRGVQDGYAPSWPVRLGEEVHLHDLDVAVGVLPVDDDHPATTDEDLPAQPGPHRDAPDLVVVEWVRGFLQELMKRPEVTAARVPSESRQQRVQNADPMCHVRARAPSSAPRTCRRAPCRLARCAPSRSGRTAAAS